MTFFAARSYWFAGALALLFLGFGRPAVADPAKVILPGHLPPAVTSAVKTGRLAAATTVPLALTLPLRNPALLDDFLRRVSTPPDPLYGQYLTPEQFAERFGPTQADYDKVADFARASGFTITQTHSSRTVLDVSAPVEAIENALSVQMQTRQSASDGHIFFAPDREPSVPATLAGVVSGVVGLNNLGYWKPYNRLLAAPVSEFSEPLLRTDTLLPNSLLASHSIGSGPGGGLTPSDIKTAYNLGGTTLTGAGQTLALFELDGYRASDITAYETYFGLPAVTLQNVLVDGYSGAAGSSSGEVTLDIELQIALASGVSKILVYESPNTDVGVIDTYARIASDNLAKSVSTSWGLAEDFSSASTRSAENSAFQQMAAQGQSIFAASGDEGAYDNGSSLSVDDPASQPYMTGVGGTTLVTASAGGAWSSETTWNDGSIHDGASGGGISTVWTIPSYQSGVISSASRGSTTMRNVPDVALNADPDTGYAIYYRGRWNVYGGTSCGAPLWSAFVALVNQQRASNSLSTLGFANPPIYNIGANAAKYAADFHDIADGSTNLYYPAVTGFDVATGWGSFQGTSLLTELAGGTTTAATLATLSLSPSRVYGGQTSTATLTLSTVAPAGGATITLSSNTGYAVIPSSVTVAAGSRTATFTVTSKPVAALKAATVTARSGASAKSVSLLIDAPIPQTLTLTPSVVRGGIQNSVGTITLSAPAAPGGTVVALASQSPWRATVPASVTVSAGSRTATFSITSKYAGTTATLAIYAATGGVTRAAALTVTP